MTIQKRLGRSVRPEKFSISLFRNYNSSIPCGEVDLFDFLNTSTHHQQVEEIRACTDKARRRELKSKLPAITPSGVFSKRCNAGLIKHSGIICIDIDGDQNPHIRNLEAQKSIISDLVGLWYVGLSASGNGLFLLFRVKYPEKHAEHFAALARELQYRGLTVDATCKDIARLRGASYDPNPYYNPDAGMFSDTLLLNHTPVRHTPPPPSKSDLTALRVRKLVSRIEQAGVNIADYYPDWYSIGRALASEFGELAREWYHVISAQSSKYNARECDRQYNRCIRTCAKTSINTFFWHCRQYGLTTKPLTV